MSDPGKAVFLSYASQDAEAAKRICEALRQAGVEVWFDQSELVGGDAWDQKIRRQIKECTLLIPIISANTQARTEGYFRLEWRLADQRTHLMAKGRPFLLPVVIDDTRDAEAHVPDSFLEVQWTKAPGGQVPPSFVARVQKLLTAGTTPPVAGGADPGGTAGDKTPGATPPAAAAAWRSRWIFPAAIAGVLIAAAAAITLSRDRSAATAAAPTARSPVEDSLARVVELLGRPEMARAELELADGLCRQASELDPSNAEVLAAWSIVHTWTFFHGYDRSPERQEAARGTADKAMRLAPQSYEARLAQAMFWVRADFAPDRLAEAQRILRQLLRERPDEPRALFALGFCLMNDPRAQEEGFALLERLARNPAFAAVALNEVGWLQYFTGRFALAQSAADRSVAARPYWNNLGLQITLALHVHGDPARAKRFLAQMPASILQEDWGIMLAWKTYLWSREPQLALAAVESVQRDWVRNFFNDTPRAYLQAVARQAAGQQAAARRDYERALEQFNQALAKDPNNGFCLLHKAVTQRALGQEAAALETYRLLVELKDSLQGNFVALARVQFAPPAEAVAFARTMVQSPFTLAMDNTARVDFTASALRLNPWFDRLRNAPGFAAVLAEATAREAAPDTGALAPNAPDKSVAVLAFANLSDDKANEYFSDGISEELLNVLAKVPGLKVSARTSAFFFKGKDVPIPEIAQKLGVAYVVEGSVRKQGDKVRITAQLIKAADGFHVWSDTFTRDLTDIFAVQDEIAGLIARELKLTLAPGGGGPRAVDPVALELYLRGRQAWTLRTSETLAEAEQLMQQAIARQPELARAHVGLAEVWLIQAEFSNLLQFRNRHSHEWDRISGQLAEAARFEPDSADYHAAQGNLANLRWDFPESDRHFRRALELNPNHASALQWYARFLAQQGRMGEALQRIDAAMVADPFAPRIVSNAAMLYVMAGRSQQGLELAERALAMPGSKDQAFTWKCEALLALGRNDELAALLRHDLATAPPESRSIAAIYLAQAGFIDEARRHYQSLEALDFYYGIRGKLTFGRTGEAVALLDAERAYQAACEWMAYLPPFDRLRAEPRFQEMLARLGLTEADARAQAWRAAHPPGKSVDAL